MISQVESNRARPSFNILFALADRLEVLLEKLLSNVELSLEYTSKQKLALSMCASKQYKTAIPLLEELLDATGIPIAKVDLQFELGICYLGIGDYDKALSHFEDVFELGVFHQDHDRLTDTLLNMGKVAMGKKEYQIALFHSQRSLEELEKVEEVDPSLRVKILAQIGEIYQVLGKIDEAGNVYADVANIYLENDEIQEAWGFAEKAHLILQHNDVAMGKVNRVLAFVFFKQGDQEKGSKYLDNAITIFEQNGRLADYVEAVMHMGHYLSEKGRHKEAFERIEKMHDYMVQKLNDKGILLQ